MSGHYEEREIKIKLIETTYLWDNKSDTRYELRAYESDNDENYTVLKRSAHLWDLFK